MNMDRSDDNLLVGVSLMLGAGYSSSLLEPLWVSRPEDEELSA
jgi:hypothetical protein